MDEGLVCWLDKLLDGFLLACWLEGQIEDIFLLELFNSKTFFTFLMDWNSILGGFTPIFPANITQLLKMN